MNFKKIIQTLIHPLVLWVLCGATIGIGRMIMSLNTALIIHAIVAPIFAMLISWRYFRNFNYTTPLQTAFIFTLIIVIMDAGLVAPVFEKSYAMFQSLLGTWIPFASIFLSVYFAGLIFKRRNI